MTLHHQPKAHLTAHALQRYRERVADLGAAEIRERLSSPAIMAAINFGARFVRLPTGQRIVIEDGMIVTVLPAESYRRNVRRFGLGRFGNTRGTH